MIRTSATPPIKVWRIKLNIPITDGAIYNTAVDLGVMTSNEIRRLFGLPEIDTRKEDKNGKKTNTKTQG